MEYQIARVSDGLVMLQRDEESDWVISEELTKLLVPISITFEYKTKMTGLSKQEAVMYQSVDRNTQILVTLMSFVDAGYTDLAKDVASAGQSYYTGCKPIGLYTSQCANLDLIDNSDNWSDEYANCVFNTTAEVFEMYTRLTPRSSDYFTAGSILEYYHTELVKYIKRRPDVFNERSKRQVSWSDWLINLKNNV